MGRTARGIVALFDALIMITAAFAVTGADVALVRAHAVLWGAAIAALVCAGVVLASQAAAVAWVAIGYVAYAGLFSAGAPNWLIAALALALIPLVPRPRGSIALGVGVAAAVALGLPIALRYVQLP